MQFSNDSSKPLLQGAGETNVSIYFKGAGTGTVHLGDGELEFPDADGNADEYIKTDGAGTLSFAAPPAAQAWELIETNTVTGSAAASVSFSSLSTDYTAYRLTMMYESDQGGTNGQCRMTFNSDTGTNYGMRIDSGTGTDFSSQNGIRFNTSALGMNRMQLINVIIQNLTATDDKSCTFDSVVMGTSKTVPPDNTNGGGYWDNNAKITTITLAPVGTGSGDKIVVGSKFILEGTK